jgi:rare lipoprotein A
MRHPRSAGAALFAALLFVASACNRFDSPAEEIRLMPMWPGISDEPMPRIRRLPVPFPERAETVPPGEQILPPMPLEDAPSSDSIERGIASWYRDWRTASGEPYRRTAYTAAHRTLPFGTRVRVRNLDNDREIVVRITDRGPFIKGRIIDLSEAAAEELGLRRTGTAQVEIEILWKPPD